MKNIPPPKKSSRALGAKERQGTPQSKGKVEKATTPLLIDNHVQASVGTTVEDLTALCILLGIKGFGPQKFKEFWKAELKASDIVHGRVRLPMPGKRWDIFRAALDKGIENL